jgi:hypothetical protein
MPNGLLFFYGSNQLRRQFLEVQVILVRHIFQGIEKSVTAEAFAGLLVELFENGFGLSKSGNNVQDCHVRCYGLLFIRDIFAHACSNRRLSVVISPTLSEISIKSVNRFFSAAGEIWPVSRDLTASGWVGSVWSQYSQ